MIMDSKNARETVVALAGLGALAVCILACTSFSPDDKKILYPTFDPQARAMGIGLYDRPSRKSRVLFASRAMSEQGEAKTPVTMRSEWLPDGKHVVVTWNPVSEAKEDKSVATFALLSLDGKEPVRLMHLTGLKDCGVCLHYPLPMVGTRAYVNAGSNIITLDLLTGETQVRTNGQELVVFASSVPGRLGFMAEIAEDRIECGLLNPETLTKEWRVEVEQKKDGGDGFFAFSPVGRKVVFTPDRGKEPVLTIYEEGKPARSVPVPVTEEEQLSLGQVTFSPDGRSLFVAFEAETEGKDGKSLGVVELPLDGSPARRTVLVSGAKLTHDQSVAFFQFGLSHDGKALAVSSAYEAVANEGFRAEDCALFIVDLASARRAVTKISIPLPVGCGSLK
jgi:WD40-like Beta Propeller Repeat